MTKLTDCGIANLLGAIFGKDPDNIKTRLGIPLNYPQCLQCGGRLPNQHRKFCSVDCVKAYHRINVSCSECGNLFQRYTKAVIHGLSHLQLNGKKQQFIFCSRKCLGSFSGKHYGFGVHPENQRYGCKRKWNWDLLLHLQRETGYGVRRLSRLTGVPAPTVSYILAKSRKAE